jgi:uncharacterized membrane protein
MSIEFTQPWLMLWAIPALVLIWLFWKTSRASTTAWIRNLSLTLRAVAVLMLLAGLAGVSLDSDSDSLSIVVLRDLSDSVSRLETDAALGQISERLGSLNAPDQVALISFGAEPVLEQALALKLGPGKPVSIRQDVTDISAAFRYAASFLTANASSGGKRIILLSDGNPTEGDAIREARNLAAAGITVDVWPIVYDRFNEILVESVSAPQEVEPGQTFEVDAVIESTVETTTSVVIREGGEILSQQEIDLAVGKNRVSFPAIAGVSQRRFQVQINPAEGTDSSPLNNAGSVLVSSRENSQVLIVSENGDSPIAGYLQGSQILIQQMRAADLSTVIADYTTYSSIILDNVSYFSVRKEVAQLIEGLVHSNGVGLLMVGGPNSFGAGGWKGTPVEEALPVTMDIRQRKIIPNGALAIILHTCEFPQGNLWARQISLSALDALTPKDYFGLLIYKNGVDGWGIPMTPVNDKTVLSNKINLMSPEDMLLFQPSMQMGLKGLLAADAKSRHLIIISDGDPTAPSQQLLQQYVDSGIKVSTICIQPHSGNFPELVLRKISSTTGGRFYRMDDPTQLPRIFFREALQVRKNLIDETEFQPLLRESADPVQGISGFPPVRGIVLTTTRPLATEILINDEEDPLLAIHRHGIGVTAAFTSDSGERWSAPWVGWDGHSKFWAQLVRTVSRPEETDALQAVTRVDGRGGMILIDAIDEAGQFIDGLDLTASFLAPDLKSRPIEIRQDGPGRYVGNFPVRQQGDYLVTIEGVLADGSNAGLTRTFSVGYPAEFRTLSSDEEYLGAIAMESGGRVIDSETDLLERPEFQQGSQTPLWPLFTRWALVLFFVDILIRRIHFGPIRQKPATVTAEVTDSEETSRSPKIRKSPIRTQELPRKENEAFEDQSTEAEEEQSENLKALLRARNRRRKGPQGKSE